MSEPSKKKLNRGLDGLSHYRFPAAPDDFKRWSQHNRRARLSRGSYVPPEPLDPPENLDPSDLTPS